MSDSKSKKTENTAKKQNAKNKAPHALIMLIIIVAKKKGDFFIDLLLDNEVNIALSTSGQGTVNPKILSSIDALASEKTVIFGLCRQDKEKDILALINEKFQTVKGGKGIAFSIPMSSVVGVSSYKFLANKQR